MLGPFFCPIDPLTVASSAVQNSPFFLVFAHIWLLFGILHHEHISRDFFHIFRNTYYQGFPRWGRGAGGMGAPPPEDFPGLPPAPLPPIKNGNAPYPPAEESLRFLRVFWQKFVRPPTMGGAPPPMEVHGGATPMKSCRRENPALFFGLNLPLENCILSTLCCFPGFPDGWRWSYFFLANFFLKGNISGCFFQFLEIFISWTFWGRKWPNFFILCTLFFLLRMNQFAKKNHV